MSGKCALHNFDPWLLGFSHLNETNPEGAIIEVDRNNVETDFREISIQKQFLVNPTMYLRRIAHTRTHICDSHVSQTSPDG